MIKSKRKDTSKIKYECNQESKDLTKYKSLTRFRTI